MGSSKALDNIILIISDGGGMPGGDTPTALAVLQEVARQVRCCGDSASALAPLAADTADLVVIWETGDPASVRTLLARLRTEAPDVPAVVVSDRPDVNSAVECLRAGARDYLAGPLSAEALPRILAAAGRAGQHRRSRDRFFCPGCPPDVPIVGRSRAIERMLEMIRLVADSSISPVLIVGETGTGKELAARAVHCMRGGQDDKFVAVNCATLTANLLESELFGHVKGAFTGADREKTGLFELADGGTIFLDEISEMPVGLQAKLLRVLQERTFRKVGGTRDIPCRATVIASSNQNLAQATREGRFRPDLYYRLAVLPIVVQPLRSAERSSDIPLLAEYFAETLHQAGRQVPRRVGDAAKTALLRHTWPGNVRELRNVIERALVLERGPEITPESLVLGSAAIFEPVEAAAPADDASLQKAVSTAPAGDFSLETAERLFIMRALQETGWQRTRAAALLGITRATLHAKLKRYRIQFPEGNDASAPAAAAPDRTRIGAPVTAVRV